MEKKIKINLIYFALRNLSRHKIKTILTTLSVIVGISLYIFTDAWLLGIDIDTQRNIINYETGSVKIYTQNYFDKKNEYPMYENFNNYSKIIKKLSENGFNSTPRSVFTGSLISPNKEVPFLFIGVDPQSENKVFKYKKFISGNFIENGKYEILIGSRGALNLKVKTNDVVRLSTTIDKKDENGKIKHIYQVIDLTIAGIINSPNPKINGNICYLPLDILQDEKGLLLDGSITEICIRKANASETELPGKSETPDNIKNILGTDLDKNLIAVGWEEDAKDYLLVTRQKNTFSKLLISLLFIIAFIGITNTILMSIIERTKEIGMLRALGMTDFSIIKLFIYEAALIGFIGSIIGIIIGVILNFYMVNVGINFDKLLENYGTNYGYRVIGSFKSAWNYNTIFLSGIFGTIISGLTAILPIRKVLKSSISESLRFE